MDDSKLRLKAATARAKSALSHKAANRLTDMMVQEVSLVDRAANNRTFVVMKRDVSALLTALGMPDPRAFLKHAGTNTNVDAATGEPLPPPPALAPPSEQRPAALARLRKILEG